MSLRELVRAALRILAVFQAFKSLYLLPEIGRVLEYVLSPRYMGGLGSPWPLYLDVVYSTLSILGVPIVLWFTAGWLSRRIVPNASVAIGRPVGGANESLAHAQPVLTSGQLLRIGAALIGFGMALFGVRDLFVLALGKTSTMETLGLPTFTGRFWHETDNSMMVFIRALLQIILGLIVVFTTRSWRAIFTGNDARRDSTQETVPATPDSPKPGA